MKEKYIRKHNRIPLLAIYSSANYFFVTICVNNRACVFDTCLNGKIMTNDSDIEILGNGDTELWGNGDTEVAATTKICVDSLFSVIDMYENVSLGDWVIMPNHLHLIITFSDTPIVKLTGKSSYLGAIIKSFKINFQKSIVEQTSVSPLLKKYFSKFELNYHKFWQKSFYDHIIRDGQDYERIQEYIYNNPAKWELDILNPKNQSKFETWVKTKNTTKDVKVNHQHL
jgi:putative transposase